MLLSFFYAVFLLFFIFIYKSSVKGLEKPIDIEEQQLVTPERTGFVAVEWGGTEIK